MMKIEIIRLKDGQGVHELKNEINAFIKDKTIIDIKFSEFEFAPDSFSDFDEYLDFHTYHMSFIILYESCNAPASQL